jgi:myosin heavy subunit
MTFDAITDAMKRLESPEPGPATEMSRAMARGDFAEAKKQLEKLAEQVKNGEMTQEEKEQLQKQAEKMSEALGQMAQNRQQLEEQLQAAGMSEQQAKQAAADPAALEQALKDQGLSQEQIDQLKQQAQAQQNASDAAAAMSQAMGQMAQGMQAGSEQQAGEGLESMSGQLSNMEKMQSEMQSLEQAMGECSSQMASVCENPGNGQGTANGQGSQWGPNGQFQQGQSMSQGSGSGSAGQGLGTGPQEQATDFVLKNEKAKVNTTGDGPVIASTLVYGSQVRGESTAAFSEVVKSAEAQAAEAIETKRVPREHEEAVKAYFGRLQKAANEQSGTAKPAESGKDADKGSGI